MADIAAEPTTLPGQAAARRPGFGPVQHLRQRTSLWTGLALGVGASIVPATVVAQPGSVALLKIAAAALLALLPGWLYVVYLDRRGESLYDEFVLNLFRLRIDAPANLPMPPQHTTHYRGWKEQHDTLRTSSKDNLYRRRFEAIYGRQAVSTRAAIDAPGTAVSQVENFSPVLLATVIIGVGWVLTLQPELLADTRLLSGVQLSGRPAVPVQALQFAFVGAYAFVLQDLIRRYFVVDLRTTAYVAAISRIIFVVLVVAVLYSADGTVQPLEMATAFAIGFVPRAALEAVQARTVRPLARVLQGRRNERLLGELDGMDIWQETRFAELGIENLQQLVTADLVEVMLRSRTPLQRLVDWLDRALLLLLLPAPRGARDRRCEALLGAGVRYATDLVRAHEGASPAAKQALAAALGMSVEGVAVAVESLRHERSYAHVSAYRGTGRLDDDLPHAG